MGCVNSQNTTVERQMEQQITIQMLLSLQRPTQHCDTRTRKACLRCTHP